MDLAKYAVTAVLVEGRSLRSVAASTGRSKSWVARHVALYREGGDEALTPRKRGPAVGPRRTSPEPGLSAGLVGYPLRVQTSQKYCDITWWARRDLNPHVLSNTGT